MPRSIKSNLLWIIYAAFMIIAVLSGGTESFLTTESEYIAGKYVLLIAFLAFLAYSFHAGRKENFFKAVGKINSFYWGKQISIDLYISVFLSLAFIGLHEGSVTTMLLWLIPLVLFANLAILPYVILNYGSIIERFFV